MRYLVSFILSILLASCTVYTEKRSEALSQSVFATSDSIEFARFDLASKYAKQAEKLAFPPKNRIKINPVYTPSKTSTASTDLSKILVKVDDNFAPPVVATGFLDEQQEQPVLRLVVPEHLKHAKLLIENSIEWEDLLRTKEFSNKLQEDNTNLKRLTDSVNEELQRQTEMNSRMVSDLKELQKKIVEKDLAILKRNIIIASLLFVIGGGVYLRIKGIL
jgi:hypothetical protein